MIQKNGKIEVTEQERTVLGVLYSVGLNPIDTDTNEYLINGKKLKLDFDGILLVCKNRIGDDRDLLTSLLKSLQDKSMIIFENVIYSLSDTGSKIGKKVRTKWLSDFYDNELMRCAESKAYNEFCERVYGENLLQYNVVDIQQLDMMQDKLKINSNDVVLDLGCGLGGITEYLAKKTGAQITGVDFSEKCIQLAESKGKGIANLKFKTMDINELNFPSNTFDVILALDVLYWLDDLNPVLQKIKDILKPDGRMGVFYVNFKDQEDPDKPFGWENSKFTKLLEQNNFSFVVFDVCQEAVEIWKRKLAIGKELREQFLSEKNEDIIDSRLNGGANVIKKFAANEQKRYFYFVKNK